MPHSERITIDPAVLAGKHVIKDTRLAVAFLLELLAAGESIVRAALLEEVYADHRFSDRLELLDALYNEGVWA